MPAADDVVADSAVVDRTTSQTSDDTGGARVETYQCSELRFNVRIEDAMAHIELPDRTLQLPLSSTSAGARYTDGSSTFWEDQGRASLELPEGSHFDCERAPPVDVIPTDTLLRP
jgi:membrane-bound inhibitor of C-type lysozyme